MITNSFSWSVKVLAQDLMKKVSFHTPDEFNVIPGKDQGVLEGDGSSQPDLITCDPQIAEVPVREKIKRAIDMEAAALDFSPQVTGSMIASCQD
ncbi:MAG: hypothetical protein FJY81_00555, partial [Candidatus Aminicenantes bacterium]|nr:hypothetical protein [Candidatus Aminicenantes bacterium]